MVPRHYPRLAIEFIHGPLDGQVSDCPSNVHEYNVLMRGATKATIVTPEKAAQLRRQNIPIGTYSRRDSKNPSHFIWDGER